jgi:L-malate glycosyltransferase
MTDPIHSIHILGSREFGGADQFYVRLVRALKKAGQPVTAINRPHSPVANALQNDTLPKIHLPLANRWDAWSALKIRSILKSHEPCVVQTYMGRATRLTRVPKGSGTVHIARLGGFYKIDGYYRHADAWVGNTQAICDFLVKSGMPAPRVHHIGNFVPEPILIDDAQQSALRLQHRVPENAWVIFALGRLISKKGFHDLFRAIARLPQEIDGRPWVLLLAGDGPEKQALEILATELGISEHVRMLGWQDPPDVFYNLTDVFVCPSRHEPLGNVILEAWNHFLPVVSTRSDGALELIEDGVTGLLCDYKDDEAMATLIRELLEAPATTRAALGKAANTRLNQRYGQDIIVSRYRSLYGDLLKEKLR